MSEESQDLRARVRFLEDRLAIIELEAAYCRLFDERSGEQWARLFTEGGKYRSRDATPQTDPSQGVYCEGREALATFCRDAPFTGIHFVHMPQVAVQGDQAEGRVHFEHLGAFDARNGAVSRSVGFYDVVYERAGEKWLFADKVTTVFATDGLIVQGYPKS